MVNNEETLCHKFAKIIGGQSGFSGGKCVATISRDQISATILEKRFGVTSSFSFESINNLSGKALCLGRVALLQNEVEPFITVIRAQGIIVSSIHNEWLFDHPRLIYVNIESVEEPLTFAKQVRKALKAI
ncbi:cytoplasmic protein [Bacillus pseudomycoides]|nr:cytoplasmic protein [Bacillus pseudomycoides]